MDNAGGRLGMLPSMANQAWASQSLETPGIGLGMANVMPISQQLGSQSNIYRYCPTRQSRPLCRTLCLADYYMKWPFAATSVGGRDSIDIMDEMLGIENSSSSPQYMGAMPEMQQVPLPPMGSLHAEEQSGWGFQAVSNFVSSPPPCIFALRECLRHINYYGTYFSCILKLCLCCIGFGCWPRLMTVS